MSQENVEVVRRPSVDVPVDPAPTLLPPVRDDANLDEKEGRE